MFHVLVLGGIALVAAPPACGGDTSNPSDAGTRSDGFPTEGPNVEAGVRDAVQEFPSELPAFVDAPADVVEEFPREGPAPPPDQ
jgi:hypothetical protein